MKRSYQFLYISNSTDQQWASILEDAAITLGGVLKYRNNDDVPDIQKSFDLVIVDAMIDDVNFLVSRLHTKYPELRIIVATSSPTWQRARAAFEAGAFDYIRKSTRKDILINLLREELQKALPSWPR